jgi:hypothetical protein
MPPSGLVITYLFGYENDNPSAEYLKYRVFGEKYGGSIRETYYTKNLLLVVKDFFIMFTKHSQFAVENGREPVAVPGLFALLLVFHCLTDFLAK